MSPEYDWDQFIEACRTGKANTWSCVLKHAALYFNLFTKPQLLSFISTGGLERLTFVNSRELDRWPDGELHPIVDAYTFYTGPIKGYIAFYQTPEWKWFIKSFHRDNNSILQAPPHTF